MYLYTCTPITSLRDNRSVVLIYTDDDDGERWRRNIEIMALITAWHVWVLVHGNRGIRLNFFVINLLKVFNERAKWTHHNSEGIFFLRQLNVLISSIQKFN
jgi:hypothetical protein